MNPGKAIQGRPRRPVRCLAEADAPVAIKHLLAGGLRIDRLLEQRYERLMAYGVVSE